MILDECIMGQEVSTHFRDLGTDELDNILRWVSRKPTASQWCLSMSYEALVEFAKPGHLLSPRARAYATTLYMPRCGSPSSEILNQTVKAYGKTCTSLISGFPSGSVTEPRISQSSLLKCRNVKTLSVLRFPAGLSLHKLLSVQHNLEDLRVAAMNSYAEDEANMEALAKYGTGLKRLEM